jgi:hypothetical protein
MSHVSHYYLFYDGRDRKNGALMFANGTIYFFLNSSSSYIGPSTLIYKSNNNRFKNIMVYFQLF